MPTQLAEEDAADISATDAARTVAETLKSMSFWGNLQLLNAVLEPFSAVIMAVQADNATLADVIRYWVYLGQQLLKQISELPVGARTALF